jgi:hypothetical protein
LPAGEAGNIVLFKEAKNGCHIPEFQEDIDRVILTLFETKD